MRTAGAGRCCRQRHVPLFSPPFMCSDLQPKSLRTLKVCGVVSASDAELIVSVAKPILPPNVDLLIGMIMWPHSRRSVSAADAAAIAAASHASGVTPVGVFVDEDVEAIEAACKDAGIDVAQLHGQVSRGSFQNAGGRFASDLQWIDVRDVTSDGTVVHEPQAISEPMWRLYDAKGGGTGKAFDWTKFARPNEPWLLAGGLGPDNVADAVSALRPDGVDVASGVAKEDRCRKDEAKLKDFVERLVEAYSFEVLTEQK